MVLTFSGCFLIEVVNQQSFDGPTLDGLECGRHFFEISLKISACQTHTLLKMQKTFGPGELIL